MALAHVHRLGVLQYRGIGFCDSLVVGIVFREVLGVFLFGFNQCSYVLTNAPATAAAREATLLFSMQFFRDVARRLMTEQNWMATLSPYVQIGFFALMIDWFRHLIDILLTSKQFHFAQWQDQRRDVPRIKLI